jgi:GNAT superfamily N-acetyltransferase
MMAPRTYHEDDAQALAAVWHAAWHRGHGQHVPPTMLAYRDLAHFQRTLPSFAHQARVIGPIGAPYGFLYRIEAYIDRLFVGPGGKGYGARLLADAEAAIRAEGNPQAELSCLEDNTPARAFYEAHGWKNMGLERIDVEENEGGGSYQQCIYRKNI